jgi:peroxiredoxin
MKKRGIIPVVIGVVLVITFFIVPQLIPRPYNLTKPHYRVIEREGTKYYFTLYKYDPSFTHSRLLASKDEADYSTPEGTRLASVSAKQRDTKWFLSLFNENLQRETIESIKIMGGEERFEEHKDKLLPKPKDAYLYKLEFGFEGQEYAVIRALLTLFIYEEEKSFQMESDLLFIKKGDLWLIGPLPPSIDCVRGFIGRGGYKKAMEISQPANPIIGYWKEWGRIMGLLRGRERGRPAISERIRKVGEIFEEERLKKQEIAQKIKNSTATLEERLFSLNIRPLEGKAPDFTLSDLEGKRKVSLSDLKGKVIILYCWYVDWCRQYPEMLEDMRLLNKLAQRFQDKDLVVLTIHHSREIKEANSFVMKEKFTFVNLADTGRYGDVANLYKTGGVRDAIIIDKEGNLIGKYSRFLRIWTSTEVVELFDSLTSAK